MEPGMRAPRYKTSRAAAVVDVAEFLINSNDAPRGLSQSLLRGYTIITSS